MFDITYFKYILPDTTPLPSNTTESNFNISGPPRYNQMN